MLNKLLSEQVQKHLGDTAMLPGAVKAFIKAVNGSYNLYEDEIKSLERTGDDCSMELEQSNEKLLKETARLKNAHHELIRIFNQVNEGFFSKDIIADRYIQMSVGCEKIYGYSTEEFFANSLLWFQVIHPDDRFLIDQENDLLSNGKQIKSAYRIIHKNNTIRWIEVKAVPVIVDGRIIRVDGVVNDITERKNAEKLLTDSEVKYRSFFENNIDGILLSKPDGAIEEANPAACEMFRATEKEICGFSRTGLMDFADPALGTLLEERGRAGRVKGEISFMRLDGTKFTAEISSTLFKDANGEQRTCIIIRDVTERKKAEVIRVLNERQLDLIYNTVTDSIFMLDIEEGNRLKFISVNRSFLTTTGLQKEQVIGKYINEVIPSHSLKYVLGKYHQAITSKKTISWEEVSEYPSGLKSGVVSINPVTDDNGDCIRIIGSVHDITERKKVELAIRKSEQNFQSLVNTVDGIVWEANAETLQFTFVSKRAEVLLGYPVAEWIKNPAFWKNHIHPEDRDAAVQYCIQCIREKKSHDFEYRMISADGQTLWLQDFVSVIINEDNTSYLRGIMVDITARKKSQQTIRESEEKYSSLVEQASDAIFINTTRGELIDANKSACDMLGYSKDELTGMNVMDLLLPEDVALYPIRYKKMLRGEISLNERNLVHQNRSLIPVDISSKILSDGRILAIVRDISERKKIEKVIKDGQERTKLIMSAALDGIICMDLSDRITFWNPQAERIFGWKEEEVKGQLLSDLIIPARFRKMHRKGLQNYLQSGRGPALNVLLELSAINSKGGEFPIELSVFPIKQGGDEFFCAFIRDISERKKAERQIVDSQRQYRQIVETAQEGIWMIDENDNTNFVNKKMCLITEFAEEELMGEKIYHFMNEESAKNALAQIERRKRGISEIHDATFITKSGKHILVTISGNPVLNDCGKYKGTLAMITDITKRKLDEELIKISQASLDLKNKELKRKNTELEQFAYVASHDLQEPLRTTSSFVQLFKEQYEGKLDAKADKYLNFIADSADRMKVLINDLLDYSRIGNKKEMEQVDCNRILQLVIADLNQAIIDASAEIISGDLPVISGYPTEIKQLFQNLVINAIKFSSEKAVPQINIAVKRTGEYWTFSFADNGIGINPAHSERIFIIFQRLHTRSEYRGSGIGLAHCKKIVELHHGKIWVESVPGKGSVFYFTIPEKNSQ